MAIDGWVVRTRKPHHNEVDNVMAYRNRHGCWGLVVMAGCDAHCRFNMFSMVSAGSTNDCVAWELSAMKKLIEVEKRLPPQFYIIGDEAFTTTDQMLTPYGGHSIGEWKDSFNFHLSRMRQCVERAFALLTQRWGILWRPLKCKFSRWTLVTTVCAKLHNFCLNTDIPIAQHRFYEDVEEADYPIVAENDELPDDFDEPRRATGDRRAEFVKELESQGVRRAGNNMHNSRAN